MLGQIKGKKASKVDQESCRPEILLSSSRGSIDLYTLLTLLNLPHHHKALEEQKFSLDLLVASQRSLMDRSWLHDNLLEIGLGEDEISILMAECDQIYRHFHDEETQAQSSSSLHHGNAPKKIRTSATDHKLDLFSAPSSVVPILGPKGKSSRFKGVSRLRAEWHARVSRNGKNYDLGFYNDEAEAGLAYARAVWILNHP